MAWIEITRGKYRRDGLRYAIDTTDAEWAVIEPYMPSPATPGRPRGTSLREVVNAIFYITQTGCQWCTLPSDLPPLTTVQRYFYAWRAEGRWQSINHAMLMAEAVPAIAQDLAGLGHVAELLGQLQQANLGPDHLAFCRHGSVPRIRPPGRKLLSFPRPVARTIQSELSDQVLANAAQSQSPTGEGLRGDCRKCGYMALYCQHQSFVSLASP